MENKFIPLSVPSFKGNELKYVTECIKTEWVSTAGAYVERFEKELGKYVKSKYAVACSNGTSALHIALILSGVSKNDEVIVPTLTFIAPINTVRYVNANPVFIDCDDNLNINSEKVVEFCEKECEFDGKNLINKKTGNKVKAIIPVHIFGHPLNIDPLMTLREKYNIRIIEDATESLGSYYTKGKYKGKKTGTIGDFGCFSFNGNKIITTGGGGMLVTDIKEMAEKAKYLTTQAKDDQVYYVHNEVGYNYRMTNIQAALGVAQLEQLDEYINIKRKNFNLYYESIQNINGLDLVKEPEQTFSNYWMYTLLIDEKVYGISRDDLLIKLKENNIQSRPVWKLNHLQKIYKNFETFKINLADIKYKEALNLPCSVNLGDEDIIKIIRVLKK